MNKRKTIVILIIIVLLFSGMYFICDYVNNVSYRTGFNDGIIDSVNSIVTMTNNQGYFSLNLSGQITYFAPVTLENEPLE